MIYIFDSNEEENVLQYMKKPILDQISEKKEYLLEWGSNPRTQGKNREFFRSFFGSNEISKKSFRN